MNDQLKAAENLLSDAVDQSVKNVFRTMLGVEICQKEARELLKPTPQLDADESALSVVMGLSGDLAGSVTLTMSEQSAISWTNGLLGDNSTSVDQDVVDGVGELANLIVGGAKTIIGGQNISMTLPVVIHAGLGSMGLQSRSLDIQMVYASQDFHITILIAIETATRSELATALQAM